LKVKRLSLEGKESKVGRMEEMDRGLEFAMGAKQALSVLENMELLEH